MMGRALDGGDARSASGHRPGSPTHRARVRTWQALCALSPFLKAQHARRAFDQIWQCIEVSGIGLGCTAQEADLVGILRTELSSESGPCHSPCAGMLGRGFEGGVVAT